MSHWDCGEGKAGAARAEAQCWLTAAVITLIRDPRFGMETSPGRCQAQENPGCSWGATLLRAVTAECLR